jgi:hypothetical protein
MADKPKSLRDYRSKLNPLQFRLLLCYARTGIITSSARAAGCSRDVHYWWLENDQTYVEAWALAQRESIAILEDEAVERATVGTKRPLLYRGKVVAFEYVKSDNILLRLLEAKDPKYAQRSKHEHTGKDGKPLVSMADVAAFISSREAARDAERERLEG